MKEGLTMKFNVTLDKEQLDEIANITADKVLSTVEYQKNNEEWHEREMKALKLEISKRDSMLVQKDLVIDRLRETLRKTRTEIKELKGE
ncbi:hypothetical protein [Clostridium botulinum]|uniref:hypothetical protein n=2 Tax=Clostridium botulinum TaxID=1491 RepID=UPI001C9A8367|nr:hypothetical protein [Clostridium botulinum]MBY6897985.1 hypothetical protein [Clostridium botulinum]MBY6912298.1 hypothetical protein [Clostridium botulinum]